MVNKAFLIGNMGNDPTVRQAGESKVASFTLATSDRVKKNGEYVNETTWHNIVVWGKQADFVEKYLKKGSMIHVEGKINNRRMIFLIKPSNVFKSRFIFFMIKKYYRDYPATFNQLTLSGFSI